jgi:hypothetical protein
VLRWIHKSWKLFWEIILSIIAVIIVLIGIGIGLMQLPATKGIIGEKIENNFNNSHRGSLSIGKVKGFLPFNIELKNVALTFPPDSASADTLLNVKDTYIKMDLWSLFHDKLSVKSFTMNHPSVYLRPNGSGGYTLTNALENPADSLSDQNKTKKGKKSDKSFLPIPKIAISAPKVTIKEGTFYMDRPPDIAQNTHLPNPFQITNINTKLFINLTSKDRIINIDHFAADVHDIKAKKVALSGQIFNNNQTLEFNGFRLQAGQSELRLNGKINGINITQHDIQDQLTGARFDLKIHSDRLIFAKLTDIFPGLPDIDQPFRFALHMTGRENDIQLQTLKSSVGKSSVRLNGSVTNLFKKDHLGYNLHIDTLDIASQDMNMLANAINQNKYARLKQLYLSGEILGSSDTVAVHLAGNSGLGSISVQGGGNLTRPYSFNGSITADSLDIAPFLAADIDTTRFNFQAHISGSNLSLKNLKQGRFQFRLRADHSFMDDLHLDRFFWRTTLRNGQMQTDYFYRYRNHKITGRGRADFNRKRPAMSLKGKLVHINLADFLNHSSIDSTNLNTSYTLQLHGLKQNHMYGMAELGIDQSAINGQSIKAHRIKLQLTSPDQPSNTFTLESPFFNLSIRGDIKPKNVVQEMAYWGTYFKKHYNKEILLDSTVTVDSSSRQDLQPMHLNGHFITKKVELLQKFMPGLSSIASNTVANFHLDADSTNLQFSSKIVSDTLRINNLQVKDAESQINGQFNHHKSLKKSGKLTIAATIGQMKSNLANIDSLGVQVHYRKDSLFYAQQINKLSNNSHFYLKVHSTLSKDNIKVTIDRFYLGNKNYAWQTSVKPTIIYNRGKKIQFHTFKFHNGQGYFAIKGTMSPFPADSLQYIIHNVDLASISNLIKGKSKFSGRLNGQVQTRSLTRSPSFRGKLTVDRLALQGHLVGDVSLSSALNKKKKRYDTKLRVLTDSTKYQTYLKNNNGIGQNILFKGYFVPAGLRDNSSTLLHFNANLKQMDMWVFHLLLTNIFSEVGGAAHGKGMITGTLQNPDINMKLNLDDVHIQTPALQADYYLNGPISFNNKKKGLVIDKVHIKDKNGGSGIVSGNIDMNDFQPKKYIHLKLNMKNLQFADNNFSMKAPFFGNLSASGKIQLNGPTTHLKLTSNQPVQITKNSTFGYPLISQTHVYANSNFIKFVNSFHHPGQHLLSKEPKEQSKKNAFISGKRNLTFGERFDIDIRFVASKTINFRIIFDPVTNEHISAQGTGRMRLIMHDGNAQIFGHFTISDGNYQFVTAGIFSRKFSISGGSVIWEGQPNNARINMKASYTARPTVASLFNRNSEAGRNNANLYQRIPVKLVIHVTGKLQHMQKNIQFKLPNTFNLSANPRITTILNRINSNQQKSFKQAASILLTGNFLPTGVGTNQSNLLAGNFTQSSTYISPILSNQIISPLVSHQVNSLFKNNEAHFNFDFRFNQFNQIDLGVSLSLLNDKLVLRRNGYLAGGYLNVIGRNRIGNLGATYHINSNLSVLAFHRQDLFLSNLTSQSQNTELSPSITPQVNGLGVNAHVRFNTWQQLVHKVQNFFRRLFGKKEIDFKKRKHLSEKKNSKHSKNKK